MTVVFVGFVQRDSIALHPSVGFKLFILHSNADAQLCGDALPPQQPPESQGLYQTGRMCQSVTIRGIDHVRGERGALAYSRGILIQVCIRKKSL